MLTVSLHSQVSTDGCRPARQTCAGASAGTQQDPLNANSRLKLTKTLYGPQLWCAGDLLMVELCNLGPLPGDEWGFTGTFDRENGGVEHGAGAYACCDSSFL
jgi:hypothetical protein